MQIVSTHKATDFDALASVIAATLVYPGAVPVLPRLVNPNVRAFLSIHKDLFPTLTPAEVDLAAVTALVVVDTNRWSRLDGLAPLAARRDVAVKLWDHHGDEGDIQAGWRCVERTGAAITLLVDEIRRLGKDVSPIQATLFLIGLYEDTGNLSFPATTPADARAAAFLLEQKADLNILGTFLRPAYGEKQKNVLFEMLRSARRQRINGFQVSIARVQVEGHVDGLAVVVQMYREILNVDAAFGIFSTRDGQRCMVIGRSQVDDLPVDGLMRSLGGGGHPRAGSAMLKGVNPKTVEKMLRELLAGNRQTSVQVGDLMSFPVFSVTSDTSMTTVAGILRRKGCTGLPVVDDGEIQGIISRRDFRKLRKEQQLKAPVKAFMSTRVVSITPEQSPLRAARVMVKHDIGRLPVVDQGKLIGIITRSDVMMYFYDLLPA
ncbi:MAG: CBS domain-containing protein [Desulfobacterales bacterium]|jgi:nanoRNase/pAp phosphatase (c-di-AMP/oligoRNAs hydrolase)